MAADDNLLANAGMDKYVLLAAQSADNAKIRYRNELKHDQRRREMDARERGEPLSARDKERERSRRESSVTRRRAEVYVAQLENTARRLPQLELEIAGLRREISALHAALASQSGHSEHHDQQQSQSQRLQRQEHHRLEHGRVGVDLRDNEGDTRGAGDEGLIVESGVGAAQGERGMVKSEEDVVGGGSPSRRSGKLGSTLRPVDM